MSKNIHRELLRLLQASVLSQRNTTTIGAVYRTLIGVHVPQGRTVPEYTADMQKHAPNRTLFLWLQAFFHEHGITDFTTIWVAKNCPQTTHVDNNGNTYNHFFTVGDSHL